MKTENRLQEAIESVWKRKPEETKTEPKEPPEETERIVSLSADWKVWTIGGLLLLIFAMFIGSIIQDRGIQDNMENIHRQTKTIRAQEAIKTKADEEIDKANESIATSKKTLLEKYRIETK